MKSRQPRLARSSTAQTSLVQIASPGRPFSARPERVLAPWQEGSDLDSRFLSLNLLVVRESLRPCHLHQGPGGTLCRSCWRRKPLAVRILPTGSAGQDAKHLGTSRWRGGHGQQQGRVTDGHWLGLTTSPLSLATARPGPRRPTQQPSGTRPRARRLKLRAWRLLACWSVPCTLGPSNHSSLCATSRRLRLLTGSDQS